LGSPRDKEADTRRGSSGEGGALSWGLHPGAPLGSRLSVSWSRPGRGTLEGAGLRGGPGSGRLGGVALPTPGARRARGGGRAAARVSSPPARLLFPFPN
jgi:hypothetical protein